MRFVIKGDVVHNDIQTMAQVFFQNTGFQLAEEVPGDGMCLVVEQRGQKVWVGLYIDGGMTDFFAAKIEQRDEKSVARAAKLAVFGVLAPFTGYRPPWGLLTGIRPAKIVTGLRDRGFSWQEAQRELQTYYLVEHGRARLCVDVAAAQQDIICGAEKAVSIYISVPFCPTVCKYCSFSSYPLDKFGKYMDDYVAALIKEVEFLGKMASQYKAENIYIGGGTPTALDDRNFERLLAAVAEGFDIGGVAEYSVEAGRPDTITAQKLALMQKYGVGRISINPQTLNDTTLAHIGRGHSVAQFFAAYEMARTAGFDHINIDLILGLDGEGPDDASRTLEGIAALGPKAVTIHTLAVKRASRLRQELEDAHLAQIAQMEQMLTHAAKYMVAAGLAPYYLYRQKNSLGNFENVGYAADGYAGRYNVQIMEERQSVYAAGAGAVTKLVGERDSRIERIFNFRNPVDYIRQVDEMIERKNGRDG
ncbi:MAG: coproporphyrinogen dehydrogenase HemZ [Defluviitaleaceae bacterium]|nr:coproporphyrinogen dehydrogenase HemZ [Defluviitaleaceae bacterium]